MNFLKTSKFITV